MAEELKKWVASLASDLEPVCGILDKSDLASCPIETQMSRWLNQRAHDPTQLSKLLTPEWERAFSWSAPEGTNEEVCQALLNATSAHVVYLNLTKEKEEERLARVKEAMDLLNCGRDSGDLHSVSAKLKTILTDDGSILEEVGVWLEANKSFIGNYELSSALIVAAVQSRQAAIRYLSVRQLKDHQVKISVLRVSPALGKRMPAGKCSHSVWKGALSALALEGEQSAIFQVGKVSGGPSSRLSLKAFKGLTGQEMEFDCDPEWSLSTLADELVCWRRRFETPGSARTGSQQEDVCRCSIVEYGELRVFQPDECHLTLSELLDESMEERERRRQPAP